MLFQFELNKVSPLTTYSYYSVELFLDKDFPNAAKLERLSIFTRDLSCVTMRPVVKYNNASI
jgi:hypothetical protein